MVTVNRQVGKVKKFQDWIQLWDLIEVQFTALPEWAQDAIFGETSDVIQNRVVVLTSTPRAVAA